MSLSMRFSLDVTGLDYYTWWGASPTVYADAGTEAMALTDWFCER